VLAAAFKSAPTFDGPSLNELRSEFRHLVDLIARHG
jgi:hypothetical protein